MALGIGSPGEFLGFAGVHRCCKQGMGREEEEKKGVHRSIRKGRPLISTLK